MTRTAQPTIVGLASAMVVLATGMPVGAAHDHGSPSYAVPDGPNKVRIEHYCTACHALQRVLNAGGTVAGWEDRIRRMQRWGARVPADQLGPLSRYLAGALPPRPRAIQEPTETATSALQEVSVQDIQVTLRYAARVAGPREIVLEDAVDDGRGLFTVGQRARLFAPQQRGNLISAVIVRSSAIGTVVLRPAIDMQPAGALLVAEIPISLGRSLAVANSALIPDGDGFRVLVHEVTGTYAQRPVRLGFSGDLVSQVIAGLNVGEHVVSLGTFFIDAEHRLEDAP